MWHAAPSGSAAAVTSRPLGFRHVALVTINDTDPEAARAAARQNGTGQLTMQPVLRRRMVHKTGEAPFGSYFFKTS